MVELLEPQFAKSPDGTDADRTFLFAAAVARWAGWPRLLTTRLRAAGHDGVHVEIFDVENTSLAALEAARRVREEQ